MKTAICFSGSARDLKTCYPSLKKYFLDNFEADIYLHLWTMHDVSQLDKNNRFKWRNDVVTPEEIIQMLRPVEYQIHEFNDQWVQKILEMCRIDTKNMDDHTRNYAINACCMYYKIRECFRLIGTKNYDLIIRARLDFIWEDHFGPNDLGTPNDQSVYLIRDSYATISRLETNDKYFAGTPKVMQQLCSLFDQIESYAHEGILLDGQKLIEHHIRKLGLKVRWVGHADIYYKCMPRHKLHSNKLCILLENDKLPVLFDELAYTLLYQYYPIFCKNKSKILDLFPQFMVQESTHIFCRISVVQGDDHFTFHLDFPKKNIQASLNVPLNIIREAVQDFILSLISLAVHNNLKNSNFNFQNVEIIHNIEPNEPIIFKYTGHGYYPATLVDRGPRKGQYTILLGNRKIRTKREYIRIINLPKYIKNTKIMPINLYHRTHMIVG